MKSIHYNEKLKILQEVNGLGGFMCWNTYNPVVPILLIEEITGDHLYKKGDFIESLGCDGECLVMGYLFGRRDKRPDWSFQWVSMRESGGCLFDLIHHFIAETEYSMTIAAPTKVYAHIRG
jgi:hypothetical protein